MIHMFVFASNIIIKDKVILWEGKPLWKGAALNLSYSRQWPNLDKAGHSLVHSNNKKDSNQDII